MCLFVLARELFTTGNSKAIILTDISTSFPVVLRLGEGRFAAGPGLQLPASSMSVRAKLTLISRFLPLFF